MISVYPIISKFSFVVAKVTVQNVPFLYNYFELQYTILHYIDHKITKLKPVLINQFPFICEICCSYQKSGSHNQNDKISNPFN